MAEPKSNRLYMLAFTDAGIPPYVLELIKNGVKAKEISVSDWAMIRPDAEGKPVITEDQAVDPGKGRGALFGGAAGVVLAGLAGPIGVGAIVAGAAIGAVTAALRDSGMQLLEGNGDAHRADLRYRRRWRIKPSCATDTT